MNVTITKTEKIEVDIFSLSHEQLMTFKKDLLADAIVEAGELLKATKQPSRAVRKEPSQEAAKQCCGKAHKLGIKNGKTSIYHYVSWNKRDSRWTAGLIDKHVGYYSDEILAALAVDSYLDEINDTKRPRNRNEFDEVKLKYASRES